jgi:glutamate dehydrogenase/leucine dehydrogenase
VEHEQVAHADDDAVGLHAIVAIHSTKLGPSLGGTRFYPYGSKDDALADVLRLSKAMSYKSAAAGLDLGGGKAVIIGDPRSDKSEALFQRYGSFIDSLDGRYITTEDVGTTVADMEIIHSITPHVTGFAIEHGGSGDPSEATGLGVFSAMRTLAKRLWDADSLEGRRVLIVGVGKVGTFIARHVAKDGARLVVADISEEATARVSAELGAEVTPLESAFALECDIVSPCALGGALNERTIPELRCEAVCGCANNQLATDEDGERIAARGITYAPDYIVNAGGVINISYEIGRPYDQDAAFAHTWRIGETLARVLDIAASQGITTAEAADHIAEERLLG